MTKTKSEIRLLALPEPLRGSSVQRQRVTQTPSPSPGAAIPAGRAGAEAATQAFGGNPAPIRPFSTLLARPPPPRADQALLAPPSHGPESRTARLRPAGRGGGGEEARGGAAGSGPP